MAGLAEVIAFLPEWRAFLESQKIDSSLYQDPDYVQLYLAERQSSTTPLILAVRDGSRLIAVAPFFIEQTRFRFRLSVLTLFNVPQRRLRIFGNRLIVADGADYEAVARAVFEALRESRRKYDVLYLDVLALHDPLYRFLTQAVPKPFRTVLPSPEVQVVRTIRLEGTFAQYLATRSKNFKQNINRRRKQLSAAFDGQVELVRYTEPDRVPEFLDVVDLIFPETWQGRTFGVRKRNTPEQLQFTRRMAEHGWFRSYVLRCRQQPVAYILGYQHNGTYYYEEPGFDQQWRALSPGSVLIYMVIENLFESDSPAVFDFGFGENQYKRQMGNFEFDVCAAYVVTPGVWSLVLRMQRAVNVFYVYVREFLKRKGWDSRVRNLIKRKGAAAPADEAAPLPTPVPPQR